MNHLKYFVYILLFTLVLGCGKDKFSQVKTIEFPAHETRLAVTAQMSTPHFDPNVITVPSVFVGNSLGIVDTKEYDVIDDATIKFYKGNDELFDFTYDSNNILYMGESAPELTEGTYRLEVSAPGYDPVSATQTMPSKADIINLSYEFDKVPFDIDSDLYDLMKVKIKDPAGEENYYAYKAYFELKDIGSGQIYTNMVYPFSDLPVAEYGYNIDEIIPDITFDGNEYNLRLLMQSKWFREDPNTELVAVNLVLYTGTRDLYLYETSRSLNLDAQGNPFAEPVLVHNNMEGGYGIFTLHNSVVYRYEF
ncbi:MAG: DUF4249 domain-containing protein [Saprospiraceae bacterium]